MRFRNPTQSVPSALGDLEVAVLQAIWAAAGDVDARSVLTMLAERGITLSTVQATLERLSRKRLLKRTKVGRAYRYRAAVSRASLIAGLISELTQQIAAGELEPVISGFVELVGRSGPELLERLEVETAQLRKDRS